MISLLTSPAKKYIYGGAILILLALGFWGGWYAQGKLADARVAKLSKVHTATLTECIDAKTAAINNYTQAKTKLDELSKEHEIAQQRFNTEKASYEAQIAKQVTLRDTITKYIYAPAGNTCEERIGSIATDYFNQLNKGGAK